MTRFLNHCLSEVVLFFLAQPFAPVYFALAVLVALIGFDVAAHRHGKR